MADLVFRSTTRGGRDFFEVTDDGMIYGGKDRYTIKTDESTDYADTVDQVLAQLVFDGAWRVNYDKIEVDELGIGKEYLEIVKLIRKKYNYLYNAPKGSDKRQFYFEIGRYFKNGLTKGIDAETIFKMIDDYIRGNSNLMESKSSNRKSLHESEILDIKKFKKIMESEGFKVTNSAKNGKVTFECGKFGAKNYMMGTITYYREKDSQNYLNICYPISLITEVRLDKFSDTDEIINFVLGKWSDTINLLMNESKSLQEKIEDLGNNWRVFVEKEGSKKRYAINMYGVGKWDTKLFEGVFLLNSKGTSLIETMVLFDGDFENNDCNKALREIIRRWNSEFVDSGNYTKSYYDENGNKITSNVFNHYPDIDKHSIMAFCDVVAEVLDEYNRPLLK